MNLLYEVPGLSGWAIMLFVTFTLIAFNEFGRTTKWGGLLLFLVLPVILTIFVWPTTAAPGNEYGTGTWFNWVKTYSALAGCLGFMAIRYNPKLLRKKWVLAFPPAILAINILEAAIRDFQVYSFGLWEGGYVDHLWAMSGSWNIMNGIAGILNILTICGWYGIFISRDKSKDMIWPDMIWAWIIAYDLWNFAYTYNCIADHSFYAGVALLLSCTIPAFFIKRGAWLQHRASTLALWIMFVMTIPQFAEELAPVPTTHNPKAFFIVSLVSLLANLALFIYQVIRIVKNRKNPLKDELFADTRTYKQVVKANS
jgi:Ca2+/Na+ antiporter